MSNEQQSRRTACVLGQAGIVKCGNNGFPGSGRRHDKISAPSMPALCGQSVEHFLLIRLWPQVKPCLKCDRFAFIPAARRWATALLDKRSLKDVSLFGVSRVVVLK